jgi:hypothetical protein
MPNRFATASGQVYGTANPPPNEGLGQSYVTAMPVAKLPVRSLGQSAVPGIRYGVPGRPVSQASGNPAVATDPAVEPPEVPKGKPRILGVGQESSWRGGVFFSNDKLMTRDRHVIMKQGSEVSGRKSGYTDPPIDGPARPSFQTINRSINYQQGTDTTAATDDESRPYPRNNLGMFLGEAGTPWVPVYGGTPGLWQPYGSYEGYTAGPVKGIQAPVAEGQPGDGTMSVSSGPPHGLHSPTLPDYALTLGYYLAVPQMRLPRVDRPANSRIGGQSYSQLVQPQGQTGTVAQNTKVNSGVSFHQRMKRAGSGGWRGTQNG